MRERVSSSLGKKTLGAKGRGSEEGAADAVGGRLLGVKTEGDKKGEKVEKLSKGEILMVRAHPLRVCVCFVFAPCRIRVF